MGDFKELSENKKVLFVATTSKHLKEYYTQYLKWFRDKGYEVHVAANGNEQILYCDKKYKIPIDEKIFKIKNINAYKKLQKIIKQNDYEIIHCCTQVGGIVARLAAKKARSKIIYTSYDFKTNNKLQIQLESYLAKFTNTIITINKEDYAFAKNKFKHANVKFTYGLGIDESTINNQINSLNDIKMYKKNFKIKDDDFVFISVGELNNDQNQIMQIIAMRDLIKVHPEAQLLIAGEGILEQTYHKIIGLYHLEQNVKLIGDREDIIKIIKLSDCFIETSSKEALPNTIIKAMFCNKPVITTNLKNVVDNTIKVKNEEELLQKMIEKIENPYKPNYNLDNYKIENVLKQTIKIYEEIIKKPHL